MTIRASRINGLPALAGAVAIATGLLTGAPAQADGPALIPPPATDEPVETGHEETAILAGGCFWGVQGLFQHVPGVKLAVSGYAGGTADTAHYHTVGSGHTGHAEAVEIIFDPTQVTYGTLLRIFFAVAHDPTEVDRQGPDVGTQYRSAIFPTSAAQHQIAQAYIAQLNAARVYASPIATRIEDGAKFYPAEDYHQDFLARNPAYPYIVVNDLPKVVALKRLFPAFYREQPILVMARGP